MADVTTLQEAVNAVDALARVNTRSSLAGQEGNLQNETRKLPVTVSGSNASAKSKDLQEVQNIWVDHEKSMQDQLENASGSRFKGRVVDNAY